MTNADKLFEELGYKKDEFKDEIDYSNYGAINSNFIVFRKEHKTFYKTTNGEQGNITMQELKAINEKVKELRLAR